MITISNDDVTVRINEKGAELQSLQYDGLEYVWQALSAWNKHSPVLFPIVGELKDGAYIFEDKTYKLSRHGFARDKTFEVSQATDHSVVFTLKSDKSTFAVYPFHFIFQLEYYLEGNKLSCSYIVKNTGGNSMYFSVGGHPAFNLPLQPSLNYKDYYLRFNKDDKLQRFVLHDGLTGTDTETIQLKDGVLPLDPSLFYADAIVLKHILSDEIHLGSSKDKHGLKFHCENFPYFGIWAAKDAPFVCLEPWCGIADNLKHDQQLIHKEGINVLDTNESWKRTWSVEVY